MTTLRKVDVGKAIRDVTITVTIIERPQTKVRFWFGKKMLTLAIKIIGCRIEYKGMEEPKIPDGFEVIRK